MSQKTSPQTNKDKSTAASLMPQQISEEVLIEKYSKGSERTILDVNRRVARALAKVETPAHQAKWESKFCALHQD